MPADPLNIGISGLLAFQRMLATSSHNITNANTEGYSRQRVELGTRNPLFSAPGYMGSGVQVESVRRIHDAYLTTQLQVTTASSGQLQTFYDLAAQMDAMLADPQAGLTPNLQAFFDAVQDVADDPSAIPPRQVMLSTAVSLTDRLGFLDERLQDMQAGADRSLSELVKEVNSLADAIANVNRDIVNAVGAGSGAVPNDLYDRRETLLRDLADKVAVRTLEQDNGAVNVFVGNGQTLVVGYNSQHLELIDDQYQSTRLSIGYDTGAGVVDIAGQLRGGAIGGVLQFRDQMLDPARNALGRIAVGLSAGFNDQHQLGMDLNGQLGISFFNDLTTLTPEVLPASSNNGLPPAVLSAVITDSSLLTTSDYVVNYDGANVNLLRADDQAVMASVSLAAFTGGSPLSADGIQVSYGGGTLAVADNFLVRPVFNGAHDLSVQVREPSQVAAAAPIRTSANIANSGSGTISPGRVLPPAPVNADLLQPVTITFTSPTSYDISGVGAGLPSVGNVYDPVNGAVVSVNGWEVELGGSPVAGDVFSVGSNAGGVSDNRNSLLLAQLQGAATLLGGANYQTAYAQLISDVGVDTHQADVAAQAQHTLLDQLVARRESLSGVNLDEEAANLVRYQQAYEAAAQVMSVASDMFDTVLAALRR